MPHANELDPKFKLSCSMPPLPIRTACPQWIRYSRKTKEQYVQSEVDGKATGWKAFYVDGRWVEEAKPAPKKKAAKEESAGQEESGCQKEGASEKESASQEGCTRGTRRISVD